jgi:hypothetical protein
MLFCFVCDCLVVDREISLYLRLKTHHGERQNARRGSCGCGGGGVCVGEGVLRGRGVERVSAVEKEYVPREGETTGQDTALWVREGGRASRLKGEEGGFRDSKCCGGRGAPVSLASLRGQVVVVRLSDLQKQGQDDGRVSVSNLHLAPQVLHGHALPRTKHPSTHTRTQERQ